MSNWWDSAPLATQAPQAQPAPLLDLRDKTKVAGDARDEVRTGIAVRGEERDDRNDGIKQSSDLRKEFQQLPEVQRYGVIVNQLAGIVKAPESAAGDQFRINAFSQMLNPTSTVMLGEYQAAEANQTMIDQVQAAIGKELKFDGSGRLLPESRKDLANAGLSITSTANRSYGQRRVQFKELAQGYNIDPDTVIGPHAGKTFEPIFSSYWKPEETRNEGAGGGQGGDLQVYVEGEGWVTPPETPISQAEMDERNGFIGSLDSVVRGIADTATFGFADEIAAAGDTIFNGGTMAANLDEQRRIDAVDSEANPYLRTGGQVAGAFALPIGMAARTPAELAKVGAVSGGAYGFGSGEGTMMDRTANAVPGAVIGGLGGAALGKVAEIAAPRLSNLFNRAPKVADDLPPEMSRPEFISAAQRQGVDYLPADLPGANMTQIATAITDKTIGSKFIQDGAQQSVDSVKRAVGRTTDNLGGAGDNVAAGQAAQRGVNAWQESADAKIGDLYDKIPIAGESAADTTNTLAALRSVNNPVSSNPALSAEISDPKLKAYQDALENGGLSWQDLKGFRSYVGGKLGAPTLQSDIPKDRLKALYSGLSDDLEATARKQGPQALAAFKRANTYKRAVETRRENVMGMLLGKKLDMSPEKTFAQLQSWGKAKGGDYAKLSQAIRSLPVDEANAVRATYIDLLGKSTDGAQNSVGSAFSPSTFATRWNGISPRAKAVLFQGEHRAALDDIAGLSSAMKRADQYNNNSNTGVMVGGATTVAPLGVAGVAALPAVIGGVLAQVGMGALLGSPRLAKFIAALSRKPNEQAAMAHIARLDNIAKAEPVIANNVFQLQTQLREAFSATPGRLAATPANETEEPSQTARTTTAGERQ